MRKFNKTYKIRVKSCKSQQNSSTMRQNKMWLPIFLKNNRKNNWLKSAKKNSKLQVLARTKEHKSGIISNKKLKENHNKNQPSSLIYQFKIIIPFKRKNWKMPLQKNFSLFNSLEKKKFIHRCNHLYKPN